MKPLKAIKKNLRDGIIIKEWAGVIMYCPNCFQEFSANSGDYWNVPENYVFKHCNLTMLLGYKKTVYEPINSKI